MSPLFENPRQSRRLGTQPVRCRPASVDFSGRTVSLNHDREQRGRDALAVLWRQRPKTRARPTAVGLALTALDEFRNRPRSLFDREDGHDRLNATIDAINLRYGKNSLYFGGAHRALAAAPMRIAFQHIPDLEIEAD